MGIGFIVIGITAYVGSYLLRDICCGYTTKNLIGDILLYLSPLLIIIGIIWIIVGIIKRRKTKINNKRQMNKY